MVQSQLVTPGMIIFIDRKLFRVESSVKVSVERGAPFMKVKLKNLDTGKMSEKNFKLTQNVKEVPLHVCDLEYLYPEGKAHLFLNTKNLEQVLVPTYILGDKINYLKEGTQVKASVYGDIIVSVMLPPFLELMVAEIEGEEEEAKLSNAPKIAILETGAKIEVPPFIEIGDDVKVNTKTNEYIQRI